MVFLVTKCMMMLFFMFFLAEKLIVEPHCEVMDLVLAQEKVAVTKKKKKAYGMNRHFQDTWVIKLLWAKSVMGSNDKVVKVWCKVCSFIDGKDKLLVAKFDFLWKHARRRKTLVVMSRVKVGEHYFLKFNAHVANEKFYFVKGSETML